MKTSDSLLEFGSDAAFSLALVLPKPFAVAVTSQS